MIDILYIFMGLGFIGIAFCLFMIFRNNQVYNFRMELLGQISALAKQDIAQNKEYQWRYDMFTSVEYNTIANKFWKPLKVENFYPDSSFIEEQK